MNDLKKIEQTVTTLSKEDFLLFREWFYTYDNEQWDNKIESGVKIGKLDSLALKALVEYRQNKTTRI